MKKNNKRKNTFLSFRIGTETFAVNVSKVLEVLQKQHVTVIPNTPEYIVGVFNFRGNIIPVIETRVKFNLPKRAANEKYVIIVFDLQIEGKRSVIGAIADSVRDVISFDEEKIQDVPELGVNYNTEFLTGMLKAEKGFTMILDIDKVFSKDEVSIMKQVSDEHDEDAELSEIESEKIHENE